MWECMEVLTLPNFFRALMQYSRVGYLCRKNGAYIALLLVRGAKPNTRPTSRLQREKQPKTPTLSPTVTTTTPHSKRIRPTQTPIPKSIHQIIAGNGGSLLLTCGRAPLPPCMEAVSGGQYLWQAKLLADTEPELRLQIRIRILERGSYIIMGGPLDLK